MHRFLRAGAFLFASALCPEHQKSQQGRLLSGENRAAMLLRKSAAPMLLQAHLLPVSAPGKHLFHDCCRMSPDPVYSCILKAFRKR